MKNANFRCFETYSESCSMFSKSYLNNSFACVKIIILNDTFSLYTKVFFFILIKGDDDLCLELYICIRGFCSEMNVVVN